MRFEDAKTPHCGEASFCLSSRAYRSQLSMYSALLKVDHDGLGD